MTDIRSSRYPRTGSHGTGPYQTGVQWLHPTLPIITDREMYIHIHTPTNTTSTTTTTALITPSTPGKDGENSFIICSVRSGIVYCIEPNRTEKDWLHESSISHRCQQTMQVEIEQQQQHQQQQHTKSTPGWDVKEVFLLHYQRPLAWAVAMAAPPPCPARRRSKIRTNSNPRPSRAERNEWLLVCVSSSRSGINHETYLWAREAL